MLHRRSARHPCRHRPAALRRKRRLHPPKWFRQRGRRHRPESVSTTSDLAPPPVTRTLLTGTPSSAKIVKLSRWLNATPSITARATWPECGWRQADQCGANGGIQMRSALAHQVWRPQTPSQPVNTGWLLSIARRIRSRLAELIANPAEAKGRCWVTPITCQRSGMA